MDKTISRVCMSRSGIQDRRMRRLLVYQGDDTMNTVPDALRCDFIYPHGQLCRYRARYTFMSIELAIYRQVCARHKRLLVNKWSKAIDAERVAVNEIKERVDSSV